MGVYKCMRLWINIYIIIYVFIWKYGLLYNIFAPCYITEGCKQHIKIMRTIKIYKGGFSQNVDFQGIAKSVFVILC